ncbi:uncharacterized protein METZ01_LOCUS293766 [marine metagenome]|uniref:Uncharacterized protein n=1 Tax=marine metagenome TaxID=408172 RepID=A0A382M0K9_9ZZZZ
MDPVSPAIDLDPCMITTTNLRIKF